MGFFITIEVILHSKAPKWNRTSCEAIWESSRLKKSRNWYFSYWYSKLCRQQLHWQENIGFEGFKVIANWRIKWSYYKKYNSNCRKRSNSDWSQRKQFWRNDWSKLTPLNYSKIWRRARRTVFFKSRFKKQFFKLFFKFQKQLFVLNMQCENSHCDSMADIAGYYEEMFHFIVGLEGKLILF